MDYNYVFDYLTLWSIVIRLAVVASQICKIPRKSEIIRTYSRWRSSKVIDLGASQKRVGPIRNFLLVINSNYGYIAYIFRDIDALLVNGWFLEPSLVWLPSSGEPVRISGWNLSHKSWRDEATTWWKLHNPNFLRFDRYTRVTDGRTDGRAIACIAR